MTSALPRLTSFTDYLDLYARARPDADADANQVDQLRAILFHEILKRAGLAIGDALQHRRVDDARWGG